MKTVDYAQAQEQLDELLDEAQRQPIAIRRQGQEIAVLMSPAEFERLRIAGVAEFLALRDDTAHLASSAGLPEDRLSELLNDD